MVRRQWFPQVTTMVGLIQITLSFTPLCRRTLQGRTGLTILFEGLPPYPTVGCDYLPHVVTRRNHGCPYISKVNVENTTRMSNISCYIYDLFITYICLLLLYV